MNKKFFLIIIFNSFFCHCSFQETIKLLEETESLQDLENMVQRINKDEKLVYDALLKKYKIILEDFITPGLESIMVGSNLQYKILKGHCGAIRSVTFSSDCRLAISSSNDTTIKVWNMHDLNAPTTLQGHSKEATAAVYTRKGEIFSVSNDSTIRLWNIEHASSGGISPRLVKMPRLINSAVINKGGDFIVTASEDNNVRLWDIKNLDTREASIILKTPDMVISLALSRDGKFLGVGLKNGEVYLKKIESEDEKGIKCCKHEACVSCIAISSDGNFFVTGSLDRTVRLWKTADCSYEILFTGSSDDNNCISAIALSPDDKFVMIGSFDSNIRLINLKNRQMRILYGHNKILRSMAFSNDGNFLITGSSDNNVILWFLGSSWLINDLSLLKLVLLLKLLNEDINVINTTYNKYFHVLDNKLQTYLERFLILKYYKIITNLKDRSITNIISNYMGPYFEELLASDKDVRCNIL